LLGSGEMGRPTTARASGSGRRTGGSNGRATATRNGIVRGAGGFRPADELRELFRGEALKAKERILELLQSDTERIALDAANAILDRVYGRPRQVPELPAETRPLPPIRVYQVDRAVRPDTDGPEAGGRRSADRGLRQS
jgi:hypothetical protein